MTNVKPVSNAPMILGIIGGILGLPAALCAGACAAGISAMAKDATAEQASSVGDFYLWLGLIAAILGLISSFMYKKKPKMWGIIFLVAGLLALVNVITLNMLSLFAGILFIIAGAIALSQKRVATA